MPVLSLIAIGFLLLSLTAALTLALLPLGILQHQGWFSATSEISLWLLLLLCGGIALVLFTLTSEAPFRKSLWTFAGSALLAAGVLLGVEIFLIQARPPVVPAIPVALVMPFLPATLVALVRPVTPGSISLWGLFLGCTALGVIVLAAVEKAKRTERQAEEERAEEMERQAQAACAEERMRGRLRFGRRNFR